MKTHFHVWKESTGVNPSTQERNAEKERFPAEHQGYDWVCIDWISYHHEYVFAIQSWQLPPTSTGMGTDRVWW